MIELPDEHVAAQDLTRELAAPGEHPAEAVSQGKQAAATAILELQKSVKPDPEGWTVRDYIQHGRR